VIPREGLTACPGKYTPPGTFFDILEEKN